MELDKKGFKILDDITKIKIINIPNEEKIIILDFNGYIYFIDDSNNDQEVNVFNREIDDNPLKSM